MYGIAGHPNTPGLVGIGTAHVGASGPKTKGGSRTYPRPRELQHIKGNEQREKQARHKIHLSIQVDRSQDG